MARVLVIGAHGKVALLAQPLLVAAGHTVTGVIRNPDHADDVTATGAVPKVADVEHLSTDALADLVAGHDIVVWSAGAGGGDPARTYAVDRDAAMRAIDAAARSGAPRFVMVSYFGAGADHGVAPDDPFFAYAEAKAAADAHLQESALDWTILKPSRLTDDEPTGQIATDGAGKGQVSRGNVARIIAAVVDRPGAVTRREIEFNDGPEPIDTALA